MAENLDDAKINGILVPVDPEEDAAREKRVRSGFWKTLKKSASQVPMARDIVAAYYCALDPATPNRTRGILLASLAYFVLPTDFIPDFLMGFGFTDDVAVLTAAIGAIRSEMTETHYAAAESALAQIEQDEEQSA